MALSVRDPSPLVACLALLVVAVIASSVPLYRMVKLEYIPSDVDEAEFEINVTAPQSTSIGAMDEVMRRSIARCAACAGVRSRSW